MLRPPRKYTPSETTQIYTDWANHYLEKVKSKRRIHDLPADVVDGVVLADVIEAVTNQKLPDVNRKPKTSSQMTDNIVTCLRLLTALNIPLEDVTAADIHQGNLKAVLTVFFALSRYKQQQKLQQQHQQQQEMAKIPVARGSITSIPVGTVKKPQAISKIAIPSSVHYGSPQLRPLSSAATSAASSRSASPSLCSTGSGPCSSTGSLIPRTPSKPSATNNNKVSALKTPITSTNTSSSKSMLDKFKLFKPNEKTSAGSMASMATLSKRPSSSSGFSSGRSEQSVASSFTSASNLTPPLTTLAVFDQPPLKKTMPNVQAIQNGLKERGIRTRTKNSPKLSPKVKRAVERGENGGPCSAAEATLANKSHEQVIMTTKPFGSSSGIPKPMAAVKGTAKVVKKHTATEDSALERTPGDGKEVALVSHQVTCKSVAEVQTPRSTCQLAGLPNDSAPVILLEDPLSSQELPPQCCQSGNDRSVDGPHQPSTGDIDPQAPNNLQTSGSTGRDTRRVVEKEHEIFSEHEADRRCQESLLADPSSAEKKCVGPVAKVQPVSINEPVSSDGCETSNQQPSQLHPEEEEDESMNVQPMTPLFNVSFMKRHDPASSLPESSISARRAENTCYADPLDGYLSESGASMYARKMHYLSASKRSKDEDSFDDSSSLGSGVSDPWNEIYGLHLKMENGNVYPSIPNGYGTPLQNRRYPTGVGESSPYKQISSTQWKKFVEAGRLPSSERLQSELWKGEARERSRSQQHESSSPKKTEYKKLNTSEPGKRVKVYAETESGEHRQPAKGVPASFGYIKKASAHAELETSKRNESSAVKLTYKTANVASVPKIEVQQQANSFPVNSDHSLERPKIRLKVSGGTQTEFNGSSRIIKPSQYKPPPSSTCSSPLPSSQQPNGPYCDSEYHTSNGVKIHFPAGSAAAVAAAGKYQTTFKSYSLTAPIANQLSHNVRERLMLSNGTQSLPKTHANHLKELEEKRHAANFAAHLFAGVSEMNGETDFSRNLDSPGLGQGTGDKLRDKEKAIKYVVNGRHAHTDGSLSDTPYTAYWNKYHPKNSASELISDAESVDCVPVHHGPKMPWLNNPSSPRLNRSNSIRSTKSEKLYPSMMQRTEDGDHNAQENEADNTSNSQRYSGASNGAHSISRSSLGNYSAILSLSRMGSKEDDCHGSSLSLVSTASSLYSSQEEKQASEIRKLRRELTEANEKVNTLSGQLSTNAHVVAAFEQSLASMTSRLQSLTLAAEQKENELQDMRQLVEQMRKQNFEPGAVLKSESHQPKQTLSRQPSSDSVSSIGSQVTNASSASGCSAAHPLPSCSPSPSPSLKKKSWLRNSFSNSFSKAFSRSKRPPGSFRQGGGSDSEDSSGPTGGWSAPSSPMLPSHQPHNQLAIPSEEKTDRPNGLESVQDLKNQLREKDMILTDIRLEALSTTHQLEALKETVSRMRNEMLSLKQDNDRLRQLESPSATTAQQAVERRISQHCSPTAELPLITDFMLGSDDKEGKTISVHLCIDERHPTSPPLGESNREWLIGYAAVSGKTHWDYLDSCMGQLFTDYLRQVDPTGHLGLDKDCLWFYRVGEVVRFFCDDSPTSPELLPCGYLVGDCNQIYLCVKSLAKYALPASLSLETLVPLPVLNRYVSLLNEHRRVIICGPTGTGKSHLARKLAECCAKNDGRNPREPLIHTIKIDAASCKEAKQFLAHVSECLAAGTSTDVPDAIILEDLHLATSLADVFSSLTHLPDDNNLRLPFVIGTAGPMTQSAAHLGIGQIQLQFNFRWILLQNHTEPIHGLLQRFLRRRLIQNELKTKARDPDMEKVIEWIPRCWSHLNKFLAAHHSSDVTLGPRWFLQAPPDFTCSQVWFQDLWNYNLMPYCMHTVKEGLQLYGKRVTWEDPVQWVLSTYPWTQGSAYDALMRLRPEDVGYDTAIRPKSSGVVEQARDPMLKMLVHLQEATDFSNLETDNSERSELQCSTRDSEAECRDDL